MLLPQDVDQIRERAATIIGDLEGFQMAYFNVVGDSLDDVQAVKMARLLKQIGQPVEHIVEKPVRKPRKAAKKAHKPAVWGAKRLAAKKAAQKEALPTLTAAEAQLLKSMPLKEDFWIKDLPLAVKNGGKRLIGIVSRLHKYGYIERAGIGANKVTYWRRLH